jgi:hypothetical protein
VSVGEALRVMQFQRDGWNMKDVSSFTELIPPIPRSLDFAGNLPVLASEIANLRIKNGGNMTKA